MKIAVLIPCYNEELTIEKVIKDFKRNLPEAIIYVYDNNSTDRTIEIAQKNGAIIGKETRQGKGNVVRKMFQDIDADIYVMVDGDDTYPADEVRKIIEPIIDGSADMVVGDRLTNKSYYNENKKLFHNFGNKLVKDTINFIFKANLKDIMSGYRAFNKKFVKNMPVMSPGFELETEMTIHALDKRFLIKEIPIVFKDRVKGSTSKIKTFRDGAKVIKTIIKMFKDVKPRQFFFFISLFFILIGLIVGLPVIVEFIETKYIAKLPSAVLATGLMIFSLIIAQCGVILDTVVGQNRQNYEIQLLRYIQEEKKDNN